MIGQPCHDIQVLPHSRSALWQHVGSVVIYQPDHDMQIPSRYISPIATHGHYRDEPALSRHAGPVAIGPIVTQYAGAIMTCQPYRDRPRCDASALSRRADPVAIHQPYRDTEATIVTRRPYRDMWNLSRHISPTATHGPCRDTSALSRHAGPIATCRPIATRGARCARSAPWRHLGPVATGCVLS